MTFVLWNVHHLLVELTPSPVPYLFISSKTTSNKVKCFPFSKRDMRTIKKETFTCWLNYSSKTFTSNCQICTIYYLPSALYRYILLQTLTRQFLVAIMNFFQDGVGWLYSLIYICLKKVLDINKKSFFISKESLNWISEWIFFNATISCQRTFKTSKYKTRHVELKLKFYRMWRWHIFLNVMFS